MTNRLALLQETVASKTQSIARSDETVAKLRQELRAVVRDDNADPRRAHMLVEEIACEVAHGERLRKYLAEDKQSLRNYR